MAWESGMVGELGFCGGFLGILEKTGKSLCV